MIRVITKLRDTWRVKFENSIKTHYKKLYDIKADALIERHKQDTIAILKQHKAMMANKNTFLEYQIAIVREEEISKWKLIVAERDEVIRKKIKYIKKHTGLFDEIIEFEALANDMSKKSGDKFQRGLKGMGESVALFQSGQSEIEYFSRECRRLEEKMLKLDK